MLIVASNNDTATCPHCGKVSRSLHENNWSLIKDLPISGQDVFLKINIRQYQGGGDGIIDYRQQTYQRLKKDVKRQLLEERRRPNNSLQ